MSTATVNRTADPLAGWIPAIGEHVHIVTTHYGLPLEVRTATVTERTDSAVVVDGPTGEVPFYLLQTWRGGYPQLIPGRDIADTLYPLEHPRVLAARGHLEATN